MNVKEYIHSGIIESYVLGLATEAERTEFEQVCAAHPEVAEARDAFERSLEAALMQDAAAPPSFLKEKIEQAIAPAITEDGTQEETVEAPVRRMNPWMWLAAACFIGLLAVGYWAYNTNEKYKALEARQADTEKALAQKEADMTAVQQQSDMATNPGVARVVMRGQSPAPQATTTVFWDTTGTKDVYLKINNLPKPANDKQYQLWALLNGQPIDLGVLEATEKPLMVKMKNVQKAQAFAITLEEKGGSPTPKGAVYVLGNL